MSAGSESEHARAVARLELETFLVGRHLGSSPTEGEMDRSTFDVVRRLVASGPMTVGELSAAAGRDASTLSRQAAIAVRSGLAQRVMDAPGRSTRRLVVTALGRERMLHAMGERLKLVDALVEEWCVDDIVLLAALLHRLNDRMEQVAGRKWPRASAAEGADV